MKVIKQTEGETSKGHKVTLEVGDEVKEVHNGFDLAIVSHKGIQVLVRDVKAVGLTKRERPKKYIYRN